MGFELKAFADLGFVNQKKAFYIKCRLCSGKSSASVGQKIAKYNILAPVNKVTPIIDLDVEEKRVKGFGGKRKREGIVTRSVRNTGITASEPILIDSD